MLTRPQWRSWLARGGVILSLYGAVLVAALPRQRSPGATAGRGRSLWAGVPLAVLSRRLHRVALRAGEGARPVAEPAPAAAAPGAGRCLAAPPRSLPIAARRRARGGAGRSCALAARATLVHLLLVAGEVTITPRHRARAARRARDDARPLRAASSGAGVALQALGTSRRSASLGGRARRRCVLAGLLAYEHAFVQAGQAVPLA